MSIDDHKFRTITFFWYVKGEQGYYTAYNRSYKDALVLAKTYGFKPYKLYNPRTWKNKIVKEEYNDS
jgi:hypothetical protein